MRVGRRRWPSGSSDRGSPHVLPDALRLSYAPPKLDFDLNSLLDPRLEKRAKSEPAVSSPLDQAGIAEEPEQMSASALPLLELKEVDGMETPWEMKSDKIFWRGASTGGGSSPPGFAAQYQRHRYTDPCLNWSIADTKSLQIRPDGKRQVFSLSNRDAQLLLACLSDDR